MCLKHQNIVLNIREAILEEHSKQQTMKIVNYIGNDAKKHAELLEGLLSSDFVLAQRSAWIMRHSFDLYPQLISPYKADLVGLLTKKVHNGVLRNVVYVFQFIDIPVSLQGELTNLCFDFLLNEKIPVAIRALSMTVLLNLTKKYPELSNELQLTIESIIPQGKPAIKSRGRMVLKELKKQEL